jgi:hypothetical protein
MKIPGRLWLQFEVDRHHHPTRVRQTTIFDAAGFVGLAYWYALYPLHRRVFSGMLAGIARAMHRKAAAPLAGEAEVDLPFDKGAFLDRS